MVKYILKRILNVIPILLIVSIVVFSIVYFIPGDPASSILGMEASPEQIEELSKELGLDKPFHIQYWEWLKDALRGDLGDSFFMEESVSEAIKSHFSPTLSIAILAMVIAIVISIPIGVICAFKEGSLLDRIFSSLANLGLSLPSFVISLLLMLVFAVIYKVFPVAGYADKSQGLAKHLRYIFLPSLSLSIVQGAYIVRITRNSVLEQLDSFYVKTAKMKGFSQAKILFSEVLRNALIPIITVIGQSFGSLVAGAIVVETIFAIPGLGQLLINSISRRDIKLIQGIVLVISVIYIFVNLITDIIYALVDPRIDYSKEE